MRPLPNAWCSVPKQCAITPARSTANCKSLIVFRLCSARGNLASAEALNTKKTEPQRSDCFVRDDLDFNARFTGILTVLHLVPGLINRTVLIREIIGTVSPSLWYIIGTVGSVIS